MRVLQHPGAASSCSSAPPARRWPSVGMEADEARSRRCTRSRSAPPEPDLRERVDLLVGFAEQARREGLLALDAQLGEHRRRVHAQGPAARRRRHRPGPRARDPRGRDRRHGRRATSTAPTPFEKAGGFAPDDGHHRHRHGARARAPEPRRPRRRSAPRSRARSSRRCSASAPPTSSSCPSPTRLKALSAEEVELRTLTLEGILAIQAGDNPRVVARQADRRSSRRPSARRRRRRATSTPARRSRGGLSRWPPRGGGRRRSSSDGGGHGERRALAAHVRRHDHAAAGAVHRPVRDLVGEHVEVRDAADSRCATPSRARSSAAARRIMRDRRQRDERDAAVGRSRTSSPPIAADRRAERREPAQRRARRAPRGGRVPAAQAQTRRVRRERTASSDAGRDRRHAARAGRAAADRQSPVRLRQADAQAAGAAAAGARRPPARRSTESTRSSSRATPTTCRSRPSQYATNWELSTARATERRPLPDRPRRADETASAPPATPTCTRSRTNATDRGPRAQPPRRDRAATAARQSRQLDRSVRTTGRPDPMKERTS